VEETNALLGASSLASAPWLVEGYNARESSSNEGIRLMSRLTGAVHFASAGDFRRWLEVNHATSAQLFVGFCKKSSGRPSIAYSEALDEALCFGWIDGVRKNVDAETYVIRFTPRKAKSQWSAVNIKHVQRLSAAGRMHGSGLKAFEGAEQQKRKYSYEQRHASRFSAENERQFRSHSGGWEFFQSQPEGYRKTARFWVVSAKREETRQRRLGILISASANGRRIDLLAPSSVPKSVPKREGKGSTESEC
jgi:uncharacterized protein YdeI (YjbR/CyaY-like superfamily)